MMRTVAATQTASLPMMAQLAVSVPGAARAVGGSMTHTGQRDESLLIKTVLTEALGSAVVRPWRFVYCMHTFFIVFRLRDFLVFDSV